MKHHRFKYVTTAGAAAAMACMSLSCGCAAPVSSLIRQNPAAAVSHPRVLTLIPTESTRIQSETLKIAA